MAAPVDDLDERQRLIDAAKAGNPAAFEELMKRHERLVMATALRMLGNLEDAKDVSRTWQNVETSSSGGSVAVGDKAVPILTILRFASLSLGADGSIRIDKLRFSSRIPTPSGLFQDIGINTDLDMTGQDGSEC